MGKSKRREEEELIYQTGTHIIKSWLGQEVNKLSLTHVCPDSQETVRNYKRWRGKKTATLPVLGFPGLDKAP